MYDNPIGERGIIHRGLEALLVGCLLPWLVACTATVSCPEKTGDRRSIYLLKHGRHPTIVIADKDGALTRYGYGDWRYYAEAETGFSAGARALLWPTPGALGRQSYPEVADPSSANLHRTVKTGISELHHFEVSEETADTLREELNALFHRGEQQRLLVNEPYDFEFVPHPRGYWLGHNSRGMVANWMESLGCEVSGVGPVLRLNVE